MEPIIDSWTLPYEPKLRERWIEDTALYESWKQAFAADLPLFFDRGSDWFVEHQGVKEGYGFYETLAGIALHLSTGYRALTPSHNFKFSYTKRMVEEGRRDPDAEDEKKAIIEALFSAAELEVIRDQSKDLTQPPDLLMYAPDLADWIFCEVKGHTDSLSARQKAKFAAIATDTGKPIRTMRFRQVPRDRR